MQKPKQVPKRGGSGYLIASQQETRKTLTMMAPPNSTNTTNTSRQNAHTYSHVSKSYTDGNRGKNTIYKLFFYGEAKRLIANYLK